MSKEKGLSRQKEESHSLSAATSGVSTPRSFLLTGGDAMRPSLDGAFANPSTDSSRLFHYQPMNKTPDLDELPKALYTEHVVKALNTE